MGKQSYKNNAGKGLREIDRLERSTEAVKQMNGATGRN